MTETRTSNTSSPITSPRTQSMAISELHVPSLGEAGPSSSKKRIRQEEPEKAQLPPVQKLDEQNTRPAKKVRFHPSVIDNSLWADLFVSKHASECWALAASNDPEDPSLPLAAECPSEALTTENPAPDPFTFAVQRKVQVILALVNGVEAKATNGNAESVDEPSDIEAEFDETDVHDFDDEGSVPRSSPPPELRLESVKLKAPEVSEATQQEEMKAIQNQRPVPIRRVPIVAFSRPSRSTPAPLNPAEQRQKVPPGRQNLVSRDTVNQSSRVLLSALSCLPEASARAAREALEQITRWQGQQGYEAGYRDAMKPPQTKQKDETGGIGKDSTNASM